MNGFDIDWQQLMYHVNLNQSVILKAIAAIWIIYGLNLIVQNRLNRLLGLVPRTLSGLPGIVCAPFLHGYFNHLFFNTIPLYVLAHFIALSGLNRLYQATIFIVIMSGCGLWIGARKGIHIGASGLIMGYFAYLLWDAYQSPSLISLSVVLLCFCYLGGLVSSLFNFKKDVSWEAHLLGFVSGLCARLWFH